jgi:hypothetical protein
MRINIGKFLDKKSRRVNITIDRYDTWGLDHTLSLIILPSLIQLKESKQGIPFEFADVGGEKYSSAQGSFEFYEETHDWAFNEAAKLWDDALDKMIWSFSQLAADDYSQKYHHGEGDYEFMEEKVIDPLSGKVETFFQLVHGNASTRWYDHVGHTMHDERIQEGLDLFSRHFRSLWD